MTFNTYGSSTATLVTSLDVTSRTSTFPVLFLFLVDSSVLYYQLPYHSCFHLAINFKFVAPGISLRRRKYTIIARRLIPPRIITVSVDLCAMETYFLAVRINLYPTISLS